MGKRIFTAEFKREAVRLASQPGMTKSQTARDLGIHLNVLRKWMKQFESGQWEVAPGGAAPGNPPREPIFPPRCNPGTCCVP